MRRRSAEHSKNAAVAQIATKVVNAAYNAFGSGLHEALLLSGCLILAGAVVAALTIHRKRGRPSRSNGFSLCAGDPTDQRRPYRRLVRALGPVECGAGPTARRRPPGATNWEP